MRERILIATASDGVLPDESEPIILLGKWCCLLSRKSVLEKYDYKIVDYHWDDRQKLYSDYLYLKNIYEIALIEIADQLNLIHSTNFSKHYWRILIGPWLGGFTQALFDRWFMLKRALVENNISTFRVMRRSLEHVIPVDMDHFSSIYCKDFWNDRIYSELHEYIQSSSKIEYVTDDGSQGLKEGNVSAQGTIKELSRKAWLFIQSFFGCRDDEYFLIKPYMPIWQNFRLQVSLGQWPKLNTLPEVIGAPVDFEVRGWQLSLHSLSDEFSEVLRRMIPRHIPTAYLEGYKNLVDISNSLPWPRSPKIIFTANSYYSDEVFKVWAAQKTENKIPLVIGQHGGHHGMGKWGFDEEHQLQIADKYISWGWRKDGDKKIEPIGILKNFGRRLLGDANGPALLVELMLPLYSYHMYSGPVAGQWLDYFNQQCRFIRALSPEIREKLLIRLAPYELGWCQRERWFDNFPLIKLDDGSQSIESLMKKSRLIVSTYNSTTYLESLSLNLPTIIFWNPNHWELRESAAPYFGKLKSVGIFHENPESAAQHMMSIWGNIGDWWQRADVQLARKEFCEQYARIPSRPIALMEEFFRGCAEDSKGLHPHPESSK